MPATITHGHDSTATRKKAGEKWSGGMPMGKRPAPPRTKSNSRTGSDSSDRQATDCAAGNAAMKTREVKAMARKRKSDAELLSEVVGVPLDKKTVKALDDIAKSQRRSRAQQARVFIEEQIEGRELSLAK